MSWGDILKDFKSENMVLFWKGTKEIYDFFSSVRELRRFLNYRFGKIKRMIDFYDKAVNLSPEEQNFRNRLENEYKEIGRFMKNFTIMIKELETLEETIEETGRAGDKLD